MQKVTFFVFRNQEMCFIHVLLNALDIHEKGDAVCIVFEGSATRLIPLLAEPSHSLHGLYKEAEDKGLIVGACRGCSARMRVPLRVLHLNFFAAFLFDKNSLLLTS